MAVTVHSVEGNGSRVGPWAPPPPSSHRVSQRCRPPNLGVAPSHRPPKGLRGKARSQREARPFRAASAGRDLIPHGAARPPANGSCWQSAACSRAPHGDLGPGPHLGLRRCQPGWPGADRPSGATAPTRLGPGPPTHAGGGGAGRGGGGWNSAGLQETDAPRGSGWQGSSGPGRVEAPHPPCPRPVPQRQAGGGASRPEVPCAGLGDRWGEARNAPSAVSSVTAKQTRDSWNACPRRATVLPPGPGVTCLLSPAPLHGPGTSAGAQETGIPRPLSHRAPRPGAHTPLCSTACAVAPPAGTKSHTPGGSNHRRYCPRSGGWSPRRRCGRAAPPAASLPGVWTEAPPVSPRGRPRGMSAS